MVFELSFARRVSSAARIWEPLSGTCSVFARGLVAGCRGCRSGLVPPWAMPPKKRGRAKAPAKAKQAKKQPAKQAAKKPAKKGAPQKVDGSSGCCYMIHSRDSVKIELAEASDDSDEYECLGPLPTLLTGCSNDEWVEKFAEVGELIGDRTVVARHQSCDPRVFLSRRDAVDAAYKRLVKRVKIYAHAKIYSVAARRQVREPVLQLYDDYINPSGTYDPLPGDVSTHEPFEGKHAPWGPLSPSIMDGVDTVHDWAQTFTYTDDKEDTCQCLAKFSTIVTPMILVQPMGQADVDSSDDSGSDSESDC